MSISNLKSFNDKATIIHVKSLAFNRTASTVGEIKTINYIEKELTKENIETNIEYFKWTSPNRLLIRIIYIIILSFLFILRLILILIIYFVLRFMSNKMRNISLIRKKKSRNIIAKIPAKNNELKRPLVIFSAHYDSILSKCTFKWQRFLNLLLTIIITPYFLLIIIISSIVYIGSYFEWSISEFFKLFIGASSLIGICIILPFFFFISRIKTSESTGSIDNASGVAILIELAKLFKEYPPEKINLLFLWCGAEEFGFKGSKKFCERYFDELNQDFDLYNSFNINIDMVGTYIGLLDKIGLIKKRKINNHLNDILEVSAKRLNICIIKYRKKIGIDSDHKSFRSFVKKTNKKFQISCFHSVKDCEVIHSIKDSPEKCSSEILNGCLDICFNAIKTIDLKIK